MKGYKAFRKGLICKVKQYKENTVFEEENAEICKSGMHFCKNPLDCLDYYPLIDDNGDLTEFAEVEAIDDPVTDDNKKYSSKKLKIGAKLDLTHFIKASIDFIIEETAGDNSSGGSAQIANSGDLAQIASSGDSARMASSGDLARMASSDDWAQIASSGRFAVICCTGRGSIVKAKKGSWITLSEWKYDDKLKANIPICVKTEYVDGEKIKEDVFYILKNGEFKEVKNDTEEQ